MTELEHRTGCWMDSRPHYHKLTLIERSASSLSDRSGPPAPPHDPRLVIPQSDDPGGPVAIVGLPRPLPVRSR